MKIIDLLNRIANGETNIMVRYLDDEDTRDYEISSEGILNCNNGKWVMLKQYIDGDTYSSIDYNLLNEDVEIIEDIPMVSIPEKEYLEFLDFKNNAVIEDNKKIEKVRVRHICLGYSDEDRINGVLQNTFELENKINEIIEVINNERNI